MKLFYFLVLSMVSATLQAQTNYVANTANGSLPSNYNTLVGAQAGNNNVSGDNNTLIGSNAGSRLTTGGSNCFVGGGGWVIQYHWRFK